MGAGQGIPYSENFQEPDNKGNNSHNIEDCFELSIHRQVSVDKPENDSTDSNGEDYVKNAHGFGDTAENIVPFGLAQLLHYKSFLVLN